MLEQFISPDFSAKRDDYNAALVASLSHIYVIVDPDTQLHVSGKVETLVRGTGTPLIYQRLATPLIKDIWLLSQDEVPLRNLINDLSNRVDGVSALEVITGIKELVRDGFMKPALRRNERPFQSH